MVAFAAALWLTGCAAGYKKEAAPMDGLAPTEERPEPPEESPTGSENAEGEEYEGGAPPTDDALKAPERRLADPKMSGGGGGPAGDERATVDALSAEIEAQIGSYREDFGVESSDKKSYGKDTALNCEDVCQVKTGICTSAEKICAISQTVPADDHIRGRCSWAQTECGKAEDACTQCR